MKEFNLEQALNGAKLVYRNGQEVNDKFTKRIGHDRPLNGEYPYRCGEFTYNSRGIYYPISHGHSLDLFMADTPENHGWISVKDRPLITLDKKGNWECTEDGEKDFIAAVPYVDEDDPDSTLWWVRHCVIEDEIGLCVVGDDINEKAGWEINSITYWKPFPDNPPSELHFVNKKQELEISEELRFKCYIDAHNSILTGNHKYICTSLQGSLKDIGIKIPLPNIEKYFPELQPYLPISNITGETKEKTRLDILNIIISKKLAVGSV